MHGTELLQMSCSTKQNMRSKLVIWLLRPIVFSWRQNNSKSYFGCFVVILKLFCLMRQNRQSTKIHVVHHDTLLESFRIRILWFQPKQDSDQIRISFFKNRIGSDSKKTTIRSSLLPSYACVIHVTGSAMHVWSLTRCVWEWRHYTIQYNAHYCTATTWRW